MDKNVAHIFRQTALERLSSPDQLDELLTVTRPKTWLGLISIGLLLTGAGAWAFAGRVSTTVDGQGVLVRTGGVLGVTSNGSGVLVDLTVQVGDRVKENQVIGRIAQPDLLQRIEGARQVVAEAKRERDRQIQAKQTSVNADVQAFHDKVGALEREISVDTDQIRLAKEQVTAAEQLLAKGLVTKDQVITAQQKVLTIQGQIESDQAQITQLKAQEVSEKLQPGQTDADTQARVSDAERSLSELETQLKTTGRVVSPYSGEVLELKTEVGANVSVGTPIISVQPSVNKLELLLYLPSNQAKDVQPGMSVQVIPTTVKPEEFGFVLGEVTYAFDYPATQAALMRNFQNENLVSSLTHNGPVTEVRVRLEESPSTYSKFRWSSSSGPPITLSAGTLCQAHVVTRRQAPIELVVPFAKQKVGIN